MRLVMITGSKRAAPILPTFGAQTCAATLLSEMNFFKRMNLFERAAFIAKQPKTIEVLKEKLAKHPEFILSFDPLILAEMGRANPEFAIFLYRHPLIKHHLNPNP